MLPARVGEAWRGGGAPRWRHIMAGLLGRPGARAAAAGPACWRRPCCWTRCWCRVCGPLAPGRGGGRPGGAAVSLRARFGPAAPPFKPAEVRHHLSLSKPASCLAPPLALASESTSSPLSTTWAAARPPQRISPGVSGRGAWEDAGRRYVHNRIAFTVPSHALMCSALPSRFAGAGVGDEAGPFRGTRSVRVFEPESLATRLLTISPTPYSPPPPLPPLRCLP